MTERSVARSATHRGHRAGAIAAGVVLVGGVLLSGCATAGSNGGSLGSGSGSGPAAAAGPGAGPAQATAGLPAGCQPYERTELFFGTGRAGAAPVSDQEFDAFTDAEITPRFPDGLTMLTGMGQWRGSDSKLAKERSKVLVLLYPKPSAAESGPKIEDIRHLYEQKFNQESVLRADDAEPRCVTF
jgi:Protein of unknown function (DUF3574)